MVKGISRQVIVVQGSEEKLFDQAIFILRDRALGPEGVSDGELLRQARGALRGDSRRSWPGYGPVWACGGAAVTAAIWGLSLLL